MDRGMVRARHMGALFVFFFFFSAPLWALPVFINELHYDNTGADVGEAVEIAGPAGTDITDWRLLFYDGKWGNVYRTIQLDGVLVDDGSGMGISVAKVKGIQNGAPDGMALVDAQGLLLQLLSYEGVLEALSEVAAGTLSSDIGVEEGGSTEVGFSLQLTGQGSQYEQFSWTTGKATFGALNIGQMYQAKTPPRIVPEPGSLLMMLAGMLLLAGSAKRRLDFVG